MKLLVEALGVNFSSLLGDGFVGILSEFMEQCWEREPDARPRQRAFFGIWRGCRIQLWQFSLWNPLVVL